MGHFNAMQSFILRKYETKALNCSKMVVILNCLAEVDYRATWDTFQPQARKIKIKIKNKKNPL